MNTTDDTRLDALTARLLCTVSRVTTEPEDVRSDDVRSDDVRRAILRVTSDLAISDGIDDVTVAQVAAASGVSEATVYYHYVDRANLIAHAVTWELEHYATRAYNTYASNAERASDLAQFQRWNVEFLLAEDTERRIRARWNFVQVATRARTDQVIAILVSRTVAAIWTAMENVYARMAEREWIRPGLDTDALIPYLMAETLVTAMDLVRFESADDAVADFSLERALPQMRRSLAHSVAVRQHETWDAYATAMRPRPPAGGSSNPVGDTPPPSAASRRAEATQRRIVDAARTEILEVGLLQFHLRSVAERAGVSVATIYKYFGSRAALINAAGDAQTLQAFTTIIDTVRDRLEIDESQQQIDGPTTARSLSPGEVDAVVAELLRNDGVEQLRWQMIEGMTVARRTISLELDPLLSDRRFRELWSVTLAAMAVTDLDLRPVPSVEAQEATFMHVFNWIMRPED